jgi:hypothetical protein
MHSRAGTIRIDGGKSPECSSVGCHIRTSKRSKGVHQGIVVISCGTCPASAMWRRPSVTPSAANRPGLWARPDAGVRSCCQPGRRHQVRDTPRAPQSWGRLRRRRAATSARQADDFTQSLANSRQTATTSSGIRNDRHAHGVVLRGLVLRIRSFVQPGCDMAVEGAPRTRVREGRSCCLASVAAVEPRTATSSPWRQQRNSTPACQALMSLLDGDSGDDESGDRVGPGPATGSGEDQACQQEARQIGAQASLL